jgi:hypothetical protein
VTPLEKVLAETRRYEHYLVEMFLETPRNREQRP